MVLVLKTRYENSLKTHCCEDEISAKTAMRVQSRQDEKIALRGVAAAMCDIVVYVDLAVE